MATMPMMDSYKHIATADVAKNSINEPVSFNTIHPPPTAAAA